MTHRRSLTRRARWRPGGLRVTALGGISEIGRNMTVFEHLGRLLDHRLRRAVPRTTTSPAST